MNTKISHQIRKNGEIISEREWLLQNQNKEARAHMKDLLAQAVVHKGREQHPKHVGTDPNVKFSFGN